MDEPRRTSPTSGTSAPPSPSEWKQKNEPKDVTPQKRGSVAAYLRSLRVNAAKVNGSPQIVNEIPETKRNNEIYVLVSLVVEVGADVTGGGVGDPMY